MDDQDLPMSIRDFEIETAKKLLDKERPRDERGFGSYGVPRPSRNDLTPSDRYNKAVDVVLQSIGLEKFLNNFKDNDIGVNMMIHMNGEDLAEIGITDILDQTLFRKQLMEFRGTGTGTRLRAYRNVYRTEDDLIMAQNVLAHLEDINNHLNVIHHYLRKGEFEDYYVSNRESILGVFQIVADQALMQTKKMADVLFTGSLDSDELIPSLLNAGSLELPEYMLSKLHNPDKSFRPRAKKAKPTKKLGKTWAALGVGLGLTATMIAAFLCKYWLRK